MGACLVACLNGSDSSHTPRIDSPSASLPAAVALRDSFTDIDGTVFEDALKRGCLAVVKGAYFEACLEHGKPFQDRSNIPGEYIYSSEEASSRWKRHGNCFLVILSYSWLSKKHPDPELFHLRRLAPLIKTLRSEFDRASGVGEIGIIIDFCALWQNRSEDEAHDSRTPEQLHEFKAGLSVINTPYAHQDVTAVKLAAVPVNERRTYDMRGWTLFESKVIDGKGTATLPESNGWELEQRFCQFGEFAPTNPGAFNVLVVEHQSPDEIVGRGLHEFRAGRGPPCPPEQFQNELGARQAMANDNNVPLFTSGSDQPFVTAKYAATYQSFLEFDTWNFSALQLDAEYAQGLCATLPDFRKLREVNLSDNSIGPDGAAALAKALEVNATVAQVNLFYNFIGPDGAAALAKALEVNATVAQVNLSDNSIGPDGAAALAKALEVNATVAQVKLSYNSIGDQGAAALAKALEVNATVAQVDLRCNSIGPDGAAALAKALEVNRVMVN